MGGKSEPSLAAVLSTWAVILLTAILAASWQLIAVCLAWVAMVQLAKQFIHWFSH